MRGTRAPQAQLSAPNQYSGPLGHITWEIGPRDLLQVASEQRTRINRCLAIPHNLAGWRDKVTTYAGPFVLLTMLSQLLQVLTVFGMTIYQDPHPQPSLLSGQYMAFLEKKTNLNVVDSRQPRRRRGKRRTRRRRKEQAPPGRKEQPRPGPHIVTEDAAHNVGPNPMDADTALLRPRPRQARQ